MKEGCIDLRLKAERRSERNSSKVGVVVVFLFDKLLSSLVPG